MHPDLVRWMLAAVCFSAFAQNPTIQTTVPLVVVPTSVMDRSGHPVYGLQADDFLLLDNGIERRVHLDEADTGLAPIALVVLIQTSDVTSSALGKIRKVGSMISDGVVGENGQAAILSFDDDVKVLQDFTKDSSVVRNVFEDLKMSDGHRARMLDAVSKGIDLLSEISGARRRAILLVGETRDRGSDTKLEGLIGRTQRSGITVYALSYSAFITPFTTKPDEYQPAGGGMPDYARAFTELARLGKKNTLDVLTQATGGRRIGFETLSKLENDLIALGTDIHSRYLLSFTPEEDRNIAFHKIEVRIKDRPDAIVKARPGYWTGLANAQ